MVPRKSPNAYSPVMSEPKLALTIPRPAAASPKTKAQAMPVFNSPAEGSRQDSNKAAGELVGSNGCCSQGGLELIQLLLPGLKRA